MNQFPPSPRVSHKDRFEFFRKFAVIFTSQDGAPGAVNISANFGKKFETALMVYLGDRGNYFMKKTRSRKSRDTVSLNVGEVYHFHAEQTIV